MQKRTTTATVQSRKAREVTAEDKGPVYQCRVCLSDSCVVVSCVVYRSTVVFDNGISASPFCLSVELADATTDKDIAHHHCCCCCCTCDWQTPTFAPSHTRPFSKLRKVYFFKSVNIWQSYKQERGCLMHFARLANTFVKEDEKSARDNRLHYPRRPAQSVA